MKKFPSGKTSNSRSGRRVPVLINLTVEAYEYIQNEKVAGTKIQDTVDRSILNDKVARSNPPKPKFDASLRQAGMDADTLKFEFAWLRSFSVSILRSMGASQDDATKITDVSRRAAAQEVMSRIDQFQLGLDAVEAQEVRGVGR